MTPPCKACTERKAGCHATCEKYLLFYEENKQRLKERGDERLVSEYFGKRKRKIARCFQKKHGM